MGFKEIFLEACQRAAPTLKEEDFMFSVEADGHTWDVYRVFVGDQIGQIAFYLTDDEPKQVCFGWFGPRIRSETDIKWLLEHNWMGAEAKA